MKHDSAARVLLERAVSRFGASAIGRKVGVSEGAIRFAARGEKRPKVETRELLAFHYAIPTGSWDQPAAAAPPAEPGAPPKASKAARTPDPTPADEKGEAMAPPQAVDPAARPDGFDDPRKNMVESLRVLRARLETAPAEEVPELTRTIATSSRLLASMEGQFELTTSSILRSQAWKGVKRAILEALAPVPGALEALSNGLKALEA